MQSTSNCRIRPIEPDDLDRILDWRNHPDINRFMMNRHVITPGEHRRWFELVSKDPLKRVLIVEEEERALGFVQFSNVAAGMVADWGFYAAPGSPRGSGKKLGVTALDFAFRHLAVHKICGQALDFNDASIRFHLRLGFQREGLLRGQHKIGDKYHDVLCFGLLSNEWR